MAKSAKQSKAVVKTEKSELRKAVDRALQITWQLNGQLKSEQIHFLHIAATLAQIEDEKIYALLKHPDIKSYAWERLRLGTTSLYRYQHTYAWVKQYHNKWLLPHPKGYIPDMIEMEGLMWIDEQLKRTNLTPEMKKTLLDLQKKALDGRMTAAELRSVQKQGKPRAFGLKNALSNARTLRRRLGALSSVPPEILSNLDSLIELMKKYSTENT